MNTSWEKISTELSQNSSVTQFPANVGPPKLCRVHRNRLFYFTLYSALSLLRQNLHSIISWQKKINYNKKKSNFEKFLPLHHIEKKTFYHKWGGIITTNNELYPMQGWESTRRIWVSSWFCQQWVHNSRVFLYQLQLPECQITKIC